ncbi:hypothetical protein [Ruegeria sediminis]|nr:hypothetical protein [Ruegeria sediminis]
MKPKSRFIRSVIAAAKEHDLDMPWKRGVGNSIKSVRRTGETA